MANSNIDIRTVNFSIVDGLFKKGKPKLCLQNLIVTKLALIFWEKESINMRFQQSSVERDLHEYKLVLEKKIIEKLLLLTFPNQAQAVPHTIKKKFVSCVSFISKQFFAFLRYLSECNLYFYNKWETFILCIEWTQEGVIDIESTITFFYSCLDFEYTTCFYLSCLSCSKSTINEVWMKLPSDTAVFIISRIESHCTCPLVSFWTSRLTRNFAAFETYKVTYIQANCFDYYPGIANYEFLLRWAIDSYNEKAVEYFLSKFTNHMEKYDMTNIAIHMKKIDSHITCYMLSSLSDDLQRHLLYSNCCENACRLLKQFLENDSIDLFQSFFHYVYPRLQNIVRIYDLMSAISAMMRKESHYLPDYMRILRIILNDHLENLKTRIYGNMFNNDCVLSLVIQIKDVELTKKILNMGNAEEKKNALYSYSGIALCGNLVETDNMGMLDVLVPESFSSVPEVRQFKECLPYNLEGLTLYIIVKYSTESLDELMIKIDNFLSWCFDADEEKIVTCKRDVLYGISRCKLTLGNKLKEVNDWNKVEQCLKWCSLTDVEVDIVKRELNYA